MSSSTSRRISRSKGWSGQADFEHGIKPRADPVEAADAHAAAGLGVSQDHEGSRGDVAEPARG